MVIYSGIKLVIPDKHFALIIDLFRFLQDNLIRNYANWTSQILLALMDRKFCNNKNTCLCLQIINYIVHRHANLQRTCSIFIYDVIDYMLISIPQFLVLAQGIKTLWCHNVLCHNWLTVRLCTYRISRWNFLNFFVKKTVLLIKQIWLNRN